jgi:hypothetical protein
MGVKEGAMASPNVPRVINPAPQRTQDTLNRLLRPVKLTLALLEPSNRIHQSGLNATKRPCIRAPDQPSDRPLPVRMCGGTERVRAQFGAQSASGRSRVP